MSGGGEVPVVIRLLPDGTPDPGFAGGDAWTAAHSVSPAA